MFAEVVIDKLRIFSQKFKNIRVRKDLLARVRDLNDILELASVLRVIKYLKIRQEIQNEQLIILRCEIEHEYNSIENEIRLNFYNQTAFYCMDVGRLEQSYELNGFPVWKEIGLRFALKHIISQEIVSFESSLNISDKLSFFLTGIYETTFSNNVIQAILETVNVRKWKNRKDELQIITFVLDDVAFIKKYRIGLHKVDEQRLLVAMDRVSKYLSDVIAQLIQLEFLPIEKITYDWKKSKNQLKQECLVIQFNSDFSTFFCDESGKRLYQLMQSKEAIEFTDDPRKNEIIRKSFDSNNQKLCAAYSSYGLTYGSKEFIISKGYEHKINPEFLGIIKRA